MLGQRVAMLVEAQKCNAFVVKLFPESKKLKVAQLP